MNTHATGLMSNKVSTTDTLASTPFLVGLDLGTNMTCLMASPLNAIDVTTREQVPTLVGYAKDDVLHSVLPNNAKVLFGQEAMKYKLHLELHRPLSGGVIADQATAVQFARHLRSVLPVTAGEIRAVIGMPASSNLSAREHARNAFKGLFEKVIFIPEPFLAALGYRDESKLQDPEYLDPVLNSLYIDIGAGSTDVCLVQGCYPTVDDQLSDTLAGDAVDKIVLEAITKAHPDCGLSLHRVREIKEKNSWVLAEDGETPAIATIIVQGKPRKLDVTKEVGLGCQALLDRVFEMTCQLIAKANPDSVPELLQNIIVTGGGSLIKGFGVALQTMLLEEGFENPRVRVLGDNYKEYVALGALKAARHAKDHQWQNLIG